MPKPSKKFFKEQIADLFTDWSLYGLTPALQAAWRRVWVACLEQDQGRIVPVNQVGSLALLGNIIAMKTGNYTEAVKVWTPYFEHPDIANADEDDLATYACYRAHSRLFAGDAEQALLEYRMVAAGASTMKKQKYLAMFGLEGVGSYCWEQSGTAWVEQSLVDFVYDMKAIAVGSPIPRRDYVPMTYLELSYETLKEPPEPGE